MEVWDMYMGIWSMHYGNMEYALWECGVCIMGMWEYALWKYGVCIMGTWECGGMHYGNMEYVLGEYGVCIYVNMVICSM